MSKKIAWEIIRKRKDGSIDVIIDGYKIEFQTINHAFERIAKDIVQSTNTDIQDIEKRR